MPDFTPDFPDETPNPSHRTAQERAPWCDEYPNPSHRTCPGGAPGCDEYPDPSHGAVDHGETRVYPGVSLDQATVYFHQPLVACGLYLVNLYSVNHCSVNHCSANQGVPGSSANHGRY